MSRRIVAMLLCVVTLFGCFGISAQAAKTVTQAQVEDQLANLVAQYEGSPYVDSFHGATQCKGFADMIYDALFGVGSIGSYPAAIYYLNLNYGVNTREVGRIEPEYTYEKEEDVAAVYALLSQALPGDYIQMKRPQGYGHSMIVVDTSDSGITVLHANWSKTLHQNQFVPQITVDTFTWEGMTRISAGISLYHYQDYTVSTGDNTTPGTQMPFVDVQPGVWYYDEVQTVYQNGLMFGTSDTRFSPSGKTNRAMIVTILYRLSGDSGTYVNAFTDVPNGAWYTRALGWGHAHQIAAGYSDGTFRPNDYVTREQMAAFFYRFAKMYDGAAFTGAGDLSVFRDADQISGYAAEAMAWAVEVGLFHGYSDGTLRPKNTATRAEVATILTGYWNAFRVENNSNIIIDTAETEELPMMEETTEITGQPEETLPRETGNAEPMES